MPDLPIYTFDIETDPFLYGRRPEPFACGVFTGHDYKRFWGGDCIQQAHDYIVSLPPGIIYAHNGGRFDILGYCMLWVLGLPMRVINNRIVRATMSCLEGTHQLRDSYAIFPFRLADYKGKTQKKEIAITKLEASEIWTLDKIQTTSRELYKDEILEYLEWDCRSLWELVTGFIALYGPELTIGTTAMKQLKSMHTFETLPSQADDEIRSLYFYGGRVDCLQTGIIHGDFKLYDVNSMYPYVMANYDHPIGAARMISKRITDDTCFITATGKNHRAFPIRKKDGGLDYTIRWGKFSVSRHEWDTAIRLGLFEPHQIHICYNFERRGNFRGFVEKFYDGRNLARADGDEVTALCLKYILNSGYGKFAQSPENYKEYAVTDGDCPGEGWKPSTILDMNGRQDGRYVVWTKPSVDASRFNVATGASITGAARSVLMEAIACSTNPVYCDTDSLLCSSLSSDKDSSRLGAWKEEALVDTAAIAGKKLYAFFNKGSLVKKANKGFKITGADILRVCQGDKITSLNDAPTFKLDGTHTFVRREVRMTV